MSRTHQAEDAGINTMTKKKKYKYKYHVIFR